MIADAGIPNAGIPNPIINMCAVRQTNKAEQIDPVARAMLYSPHPKNAYLCLSPGRMNYL